MPMCSVCVCLCVSAVYTYPYLAASTITAAVGYLTAPTRQSLLLSIYCAIVDETSFHVLLSVVQGSGRLRSIGCIEP